MRSTDVFIAGGGPAGLAAAIALRSRGFAVILADPARPPVDKTCGEGLMPDGLAALKKLGVSLDPAHSLPFRGIRFVGGGVAVDASFPSGSGIGIRRTHLHQTLIGHAGHAGATLLWGTRVTGLSATGVQLDSGAVESRWVIGADGENSRVRHWAGLDGGSGGSRRFGFRRHYQIAPWSDCVEIYWGAGCQIYVTPIAREEICVVVISRDSHLRLDAALAGFPELLLKLRNATIRTSERGAVSATRRLPRVHNGRVALLGDASGSVDAITGEGMRLGFEQSLALAAALGEGNLNGYGAAHRKLARRPAFMAALMLTMDRSAWLRQRALRGLCAEPRIFETQLAMHVGAAATSDYILHSVLPLGRHILTA